MVAVSEAMLVSVSRTRSLWAAKVLAASVVALTAAGCSSGVERFSYNPFENPFNGRSNNGEPAATGSISKPQPGLAAPSSSVTSQPLPPSGGAQPSYQPAYQPPAAAPLPQYQPPQQTYSAPPAPQPSYQPPQAAAPQAAMPRAAAPAAGGGWTLEGGSSLTIQQGTTAQTLSKRYGVPAAVILSTNGLAPNAQLQPGQRITIPVYRAGGGAPAPRQSEAPQAAPAAPATASAAPTLAPGPGFLKAPSANLQPAPAQAPKAAAVVAVPAKGGTYTVQSGDTLNSIARKHNTTAAALASANGFDGDHHVRLGETLKLPGAAPAVAAAKPAPAQAAPTKPVQTAAVAPAAKPAAAPAAQPTQAAAKPATAAQPAQAAPVATVQKAVAKPETAPAAAAADEEETTGSTGEGSLRWPVRGRVISGFGSKPNGTSNDGINLAVPEGTPVKAADGGVVAYAGNELKGYGNLVLIRHPNGYVTAYAHNSEVLVKKGDVIRRGQVISKAGKSGNVSSPQLHFEVRKGATPVDPMQHLPNG